MSAKIHREFSIILLPSANNSAEAFYIGNCLSTYFRKKSNRESARRSRSKKATHMKDLEVQVWHLNHFTLACWISDRPVGMNNGGN
jgi:hypothetical protein